MDLHLVTTKHKNSLNRSSSTLIDNAITRSFSNKLRDLQNLIEDNETMLHNATLQRNGRKETLNILKNSLLELNRVWQA